MSQFESRLSIAGVALFLFGLAIGFAVSAFPDKRTVLNAHLTALGSGTFLIAMSAIWRELDLTTKASTIWSHLLWISFYVLQAGLTLGAASAGNAPDAPRNLGQVLAGLLNAIGAIVMIVAVAAVLVALIKSKPASQ